MTTTKLDQVHEHPIHHITIIGAAQGRRSEAVVRCPRYHAVDLATCQGCDLWRGSAGRDLLCTSAPADAGSKPGTVSALMSRDVVCVRPDIDLGTVAWLMSSKHVGGLPVVDERRRPCGMITKSDVVRALSEGRLDGAVLDSFDPSDAPPRARTAMSLMSTPLSLSVYDDVGVAARLFIDKGFHAAPVVDDQDRLVGIISTVDLLRGLPELAPLRGGF